jgi:hypothetical protein
MGGIFKAVDGAHEGLSVALHAAGDTIVGAGSADAEAMLAAVAAALGPIGVGAFLPAYAPAQATCLAATLLVGHRFHEIGHATTAHKATTVACDNA